MDQKSSTEYAKFSAPSDAYLQQINSESLSTKASPQVQIESAIVEKYSENYSVSLGDEIGQFGRKDFTVCFWFKTSEKSRYFDIAGNRIDGSHGNFFCIRMTGIHESWPEGKIMTEVDENGNGLSYNSVESKAIGLNDGKWHHLLIARKGNSLKMFVDGEFSGGNEGNGIANIKNPNDFRLGRSYSGFENVGIEFHDFRIYEVALTEEDVMIIYRQSFEVYCEEAKILKFEEKDA